MQQVNIHAAKTQLSALMDKVASGESFIIAKAGRPLATVIPYVPTASCPRVGFLKGEILVPEDFDYMCSEEVTAMFEGKNHENSY